MQELVVYNGLSVNKVSTDELWLQEAAERNYYSHIYFYREVVDEPATEMIGENCHRCGGANVNWSAASPLWNYVMRGNDINGECLFDDLVCMRCFIILAAEAGLPTVGWRLTLVPEPPGLVYATPSGRVWNSEKFLWV